MTYLAQNVACWSFLFSALKFLMPSNIQKYFETSDLMIQTIIVKLYSSERETIAPEERLRNAPGNLQKFKQYLQNRMFEHGLYMQAPNRQNCFGTVSTMRPLAPESTCASIGSLFQAYPLASARLRGGGRSPSLRNAFCFKLILFISMPPPPSYNQRAPTTKHQAPGNKLGNSCL